MTPSDGFRLHPQTVGNVGLYLCCYHLSLRGWNVMPTARNAKGIDLLAYSQDSQRKLAVQIKALSKRNPVPLGTSIDKAMGDFWIIANQVTSTAPNFFVMTPDEVRERAHRGEREGRVSFWLQPKDYDQPDFTDGWERIGYG